MSETVKAWALGIGIGLALFGGVVWAARKGAKEVGQALNPASDKNAAYRGANAIGATITGDEAFSLGVWFYDLLNGKEQKRQAAVGTQADPRVQQGKPVTQEAPSVLKPGQGGTGGSFEQQSGGDYVPFPY